MNKELLRKAFEAGEKYSGNIEFGEYAETFEIWYENQAELNLGVIGGVVGRSEQLRFLIDKFQTPKGNYLIELLMAEKERKDKKP